MQLEREMEGAVLPPVDAPRCGLMLHRDLNHGVSVLCKDATRLRLIPLDPLLSLCGQLDNMMSADHSMQQSLRSPRWS